MQGRQTGQTTSVDLIGSILQSIPPEAQITRVEYEGPRIALYTRNPRFLIQNNYVIANIVTNLKKRVVMRTDKVIRKPEEEARNIIRTLVPSDAEVKSVFFDEVLGEAVIEARKPQLLSQEKGFDTINLVDKTGWRITTRKSPNIPSIAIENVYHTWKTTAEDRGKLLKDIGETVFRPRLGTQSEVTIYTLGGFSQVGRSAILVVTRESKILLDCGIHPGAKNPWDAFPRFDWSETDFTDLDAVIISHAHLDHTGFLPALFKYGYDGPVYCTEPTLPLMSLLHSDSVKIAALEGNNILYDLKDVRESIKHCITLPYGLVTDVAPDVKLVFNNAGHILGSATIHLHFGEGAHNLVYTGDYKFAKTMLFDGASWNFPRIETLITESTYGAKEDIMPSREEVEMTLVRTINETLSKGGKVIIPVPAVGRAQEIMVVLNQYMSQGQLTEAPIFLEGMISEATSIHIAFPDYLARDLRAKILEEDASPFESPYFTVIKHASNREEAMRDGPAIIMATSGMLEGGPILSYIEELASSEKNKILFVSYQVSGTMGRRILDGARQATLVGRNGKIKLIDIHAPVEKIEGFSGHSDYNQIIRYIARLSPKLQQVIVNHGERRKTENIAYVVSRMFRIPTLHPDVREAIRLH